MSWICDVLDFLNKNSGSLTILSSIILAFITGVYVVITKQTYNNSLLQQSPKIILIPYQLIKDRTQSIHSNIVDQKVYLNTCLHYINIGGSVALDIIIKFSVIANKKYSKFYYILYMQETPEFFNQIINIDKNNDDVSKTHSMNGDNTFNSILGEVCRDINHLKCPIKLEVNFYYRSYYNHYFRSTEQYEIHNKTSQECFLNQYSHFSNNKKISLFLYKKIKKQFLAERKVK